MTAEDRARRTVQADAACREAFASAVQDGADTGLALVAVGGYGRGELAPFSDLDVVLVHDADVDVRPVAERVWYPLWDAGLALDHAVRALPDATLAAAGDVRVGLGLLDARHVAGDPTVSLRLRAQVLAAWRHDARRPRRLAGRRMNEDPPAVPKCGEGCSNIGHVGLRA